MKQIFSLPLLIPLALGQAVQAPEGLRPLHPFSIEEESDERAEEADPLSRLAVLGASASAGFNLEFEAGRPLRLAEYLAIACGLEQDHVFDRADGWTAFAPRERTEPALAAVREYQPTLTLAVDLPFWFVHGPYEPNERLEALDWLLEALDGFPGHLVLGAVPTLGNGVSDEMVPSHLRASKKVLKQANARLTAFAREQERVTLVPLDEFFGKLQAGKLPAVRGGKVDRDDVEDLLQADGLHPSVSGTALLALALLEHADQALGGRLDERVRWDIEALVAAVEGTSAVASE